MYSQRRMYSQRMYSQTYISHSYQIIIGAHLLTNNTLGRVASLHQMHMSAQSIGTEQMRRNCKENVAALRIQNAMQSSENAPRLKRPLELSKQCRTMIIRTAWTSPDDVEYHWDQQCVVSNNGTWMRLPCSSHQHLLLLPQCHCRRTPPHQTKTASGECYYHKWGLIGVLMNNQSYKRHEENKRKFGQELSSMQQADYQFHQHTP